MPAINNLGSIRVESSSDAGCEWSDNDQANFCRHVVEYLSGLYPGVTVQCELAERSDTRVFVYGRERANGLVTHPAPEHDLIASIKSAVQDVWNLGDFWEGV